MEMEGEASQAVQMEEEATPTKVIGIIAASLNGWGGPD